MTLAPPPPARVLRMLDNELYINYFLCKLYDPATNTYLEIEMYDGKPLDRNRLIYALQTSKIITFNGNKYDVPILACVLAGFNNAQLKIVSDAIIKRNMQPWQVEQEFGVTIPDYLDHIDLIEVAPGTASLKIYGGRLHSKRMQDLPIEPSAILTREDMVAINKYCGNDLLTTYDLYVSVKSRIALREAMSEQYGIDLRSKSDAQMAESIIKAQLGFKPERRYVKHGYGFHYVPPPFIQFKTKQMQDVLATVTDQPFVCSDKDQVEVDDDGNKIKSGIIIPAGIKNTLIKIGISTYKFGIGGLHSQETSVSHYPESTDYTISDHDVASYYPSLILLLRMFPQQLGPRFIEIYKNIYDERLLAKSRMGALKASLKKLEQQPATDAICAEITRTKAEIVTCGTESDGKKIVLNGTFGKLGSKFSILFSPEQLIQVTITGQLSILMLIEMLESSGISVVSANTDGIVIKCHRSMHAQRDAIIKHWETVTGFETEANEYRAIFMRDVNAYLAFKPNGEVKAKGAYAEPGLQKNPTNIICVEAVTAYILDGVPPEKTIRGCSDIRKFVTVRAVKGGGVWTVGDVYLGKAVRWYYGRGQTGHIAYATNGNKVATSDGAKPCMELPDVLPPDIDYLWYIQETKNLLADINCC